MNQTHEPSPDHNGQEYPDHNGQEYPDVDPSTGQPHVILARAALFDDYGGANPFDPQAPGL